MKIKDIVFLENQNTASVYLIKEGLFWRAYERSAYRFVQHIKQYHVTKKHIKSVGCEVVYCGFPDSSLISILKIADGKPIAKTEKRITINDFSTDEHGFLNWKNAIALHKDQHEPILNTISANTELNDNLMSKIRNFQVITKSPIECQQFLIEIQNQLNGNL